jgi:hypothetical protein
VPPATEAYKESVAGLMLNLDTDTRATLNRADPTTPTMAPTCNDKSRRIATSKMIKDGRVEKKGEIGRMTRAATRKTKDA